METVLSTGAQLLWAVIGALLGIWLPMLHFRLQQLRHPKLLGKWDSAYQGIDEPPGTWVTEKVDVSIAYGKLKLKNSNSSQGYDYTAYATLDDGVHLVGRWESIRPGANAKGAFLLTVSSQGNIMYGYWVGPDRLGARRYGRWVVGRDKRLVEEGKKLADAMRMPIRQSENESGIREHR